MPLMATMPDSPDPASMNRPSSDTTRAFADSENFAVFAAPMPPPDTDVPMPSASLDENASASSMLGWWRSRPSFDSDDHITPEEMTTLSELMSKRPGFSSSARSMGLANASPTIASD